MIHLQAALITMVSFLALFGTAALVSFYDAYPEAAPAPAWAIIGVGAAIWVAALFLISRLPNVLALRKILSAKGRGR